MSQEIKDFTIKILQKLGGKLEYITSHKLIVTFPEAISSSIGNKVYLSFIPVSDELEGQDFELVIPGSNFLEELISIARSNGGGGQRVFLETTVLPETDMPVNLFSVSLESIERVSRYIPLMEFNFRVSFLSDEKIESLYSIFIDEEKNEFEIIIPEDQKLSYEPRQGFIYSAFSIPPEEVYNRAKELILSKIEPQTNKIEEEHKEFLNDTLKSLESYYAREKEHIKKKYKDEAGPYIREITEELKQKKNELIEKHKIKVGLSLINFREISLPATGYQCILVKEDKKKIFQFKKELLRGKLFLPPCSSCKKISQAFTICSGEGHLLGPCCVYKCSNCSLECCLICRPATVCYICNEKICEDCISTCQNCKKPYCFSKHSIRCGTCNEEFCGNCIEKCGKCNRDFCLDHILLCKDCKRSFCTDHCGKCGVCKKTVCQEDSKICPGCGNISCNSHFSKCFLCSEYYCKTCLKEIKKNILCKGCRSLEKVENPDEIAVIFAPHLSKLSKVQILKLKHWKKGVTKKYLIFTASGLFNSYIFVLNSEKGDIVSYRSLGFLKALRDMFS
ncbi:MAG TPA: hypothetical protein PL110_06245 [Candidatus Eremiobacteraeota bacterium]|nr:MAG: hypothetical protein BWY64_02316 [bacterium ADurb.Bin363]HPZ07693.1 hypothetical protein [Candidatus Eremiobacteraeota bacterium]